MTYEDPKVVVCVRRDVYNTFHKDHFTEIYEFSSVANMEAFFEEEKKPWYERKTFWMARNSYRTSCLPSFLNYYRTLRERVA